MAIRTTVLPADHPDVAATRAWLAEVLSRDGSPEAIAQARSALTILETRASRGAIGFSAAAVAAEARAARAAVENILSVFARSGDRRGEVLAPNVADDALAAIQIAQESGTAVVAARAASALLSADPRGAAILRQIEDLRDQREAAIRREAILAAGLDPGVGSPGAPSSAELDGQLMKLLGAVPRDILSLTSSPRLKFADLKPMLAQDEGWLGFVIGGSSTTVALVTSAGLQLISVPEGRDRITRRVDELRSELDPRTARRFDVIASHALYDVLLGTLGEPFTRLSRLIVASDGALESLPLSVLVTAVASSSDNPDQSYRQSSWLSDRAVITVTPSFVTALASQQAHSSASSRAGFLGFGDPALGPVQAAAADASASVLSKLMFLQGAPGALADVRALPSLPDTKVQLEAMNDLFADGRGDIRTGQAATKSAVKQANLASFRVIAFATHGLLAAESPTGEPALVMTPSSALDDGLLTATDVAGLSLDADLIILSACNTAAPRLGYGTDGLSGLARAFFHAGARAVLVSHWPVDAQATSALMTLLASSGGQATATAFNMASQALRKQPGFAHPAFSGSVRARRPRRRTFGAFGKSFACKK